MRNISIIIVGIVILSNNLNAQITTDRNYIVVLNEEFNGINRKWNDITFIEDCDNPLWKCFASEYWPMGVINSNENHHQAFQVNNAVFGNDGKMRLISEFVSETPLQEGDYEIPANFLFQDSINSKGIYYFSGTIESMTMDYHFGYYELKASLPIHEGGCSAFWLWGNTNSTYEEIDIYEHFRADSQNNLSRVYSCGIWYNGESNVYECANNYAKYHYSYENQYQDLSHDHIFACEWLPDRVTWYFDGMVINECKNRNQIPQNPKKIKVTYPINGNALNPDDNIPTWRGSDTLTISYIKHYALKTSCDNDLYITSGSQMSSMDYKVQRSITLGSANAIVIVPHDINFTLRAVESITIDGAFELALGTEMTLMVHECPECTFINNKNN